MRNPTNSDDKWYKNTSLYSTTVALVALAVSIRGCDISKRNERLDVESQMIEKAMKINEQFMQYNVKSPYASKCNVDSKHLREFEGKTILLLQQINLMHLRYVNRDILGENDLLSTKGWGSKIVTPWIDSDKDLQASLYIFMKDDCDTQFRDWLCTFLPPIMSEADFNSYRVNRPIHKP